MKYEIAKITEELKARGYQVNLEEVCITKNCIAYEGVRISMNEAIQPVVYCDNSDTLRSYVDKIIEVIQTPVPDIDTNRFFDPEYICKNAFLTIQRISNNEKGTISKTFLNLEVVGRVRVDTGVNDGDVASFKVTESYLQDAGIDEFFFWKWAEDNTNKCTTIKSMAEILGYEEEGDMDDSLHVATAGAYGGAAALLCTRIIDEFCVSCDIESCYILPSSTEEVMLLPTVSSTDISIDELTRMVNKINMQEVEPVIYVYNRNDKFVQIAAINK